MGAGCGPATVDDLVQQWVAAQDVTFGSCGVQRADCLGEPLPASDTGECLVRASIDCRPVRQTHIEEAADGLGPHRVTTFVLPTEDDCLLHTFTDTAARCEATPLLVHNMCAAVAPSESCSSMVWALCDEVEWWSVASEPSDSCPSSGD